MAAPVHRFAALEPPPRRPRHHRIHNQQVLPAVHARRHPEDPSLYVEIPPSPAQPTIAHIAAARSVTPDTLLRTAALGLHAPMMAPHLKFGMLVSFALATVVLAGAKYYFDRQLSRDAAGGEASVLCALVAALAGVGCALSLCRARPPSPVPPERISSTARHRPPLLPQSQGYAAPPPAPSPPPSPPSPRAEAPPPYHIAVLLPDPPAYHALS